MARTARNLSWVTPALLSMLVGAAAAVAQDQPIVLQPAPAKQVPLATHLPPATDGEPSMVFETLHHDFGRIADTSHQKFEFKFTNRGTGTLHIQQPTASCGCTVPFMSKREYAPGESGVVEVQFNPHGRRGNQSQQITINTNDPSNPQITLRIEAFIRTTIAFEPQSVNFGDVMVGQTAKQIVRVQGPAPDFGVTYASTNKGRYVRVQVLETRQTVVNGEQINESLLEFTFNGRAGRGHFAANSTVRTTSERNPLADIYITAEVVGDLQVLPPRVNVGIVDTGNPFQRMFRVNSRTGRPFKIINVDHYSNLPQPLDVQWRPVQEGNEAAWQVDIRGIAPDSMAPINATLTVMTDQDQDSTMTVHVSGAVRPQSAAMPAAIEHIDIETHTQDRP
jgi:hypothetical protein